jgi:hypothetical protein
MKRTDQARRIVFVSRQLGVEALRCAKAVGKLDNVQLFGICDSSANANSRLTFSELVYVDDSHSVEQILNAVRTLAKKHGPFEQIVTPQETLLVPVARANQTLGLKGLDVSTVNRVLDKSTLKSTLERAGVKTPRSAVLTSTWAADQFVSAVGFPIVLKPPGGSGGLASWRINDTAQLKLALELTRPSEDATLLGEEYLEGEEVCLDTITIEHEPRFYSICRYRHPILKALERPEIQWSCVLPRDITVDRYSNLIKEGLEAVRSLRVGNAMTHIEAILLSNGDCYFIDATLRPAGARIGPMLGFAHDIDPYLAWARAAVDGRFDGPWKRQYAVGTIFLRGLGSGVVEEVEGSEVVSNKLGGLLIDSRWPQVGATKSTTYTGDGYLTVRHSETAMVENALDFIERTIRIRYSERFTDSREGVGKQWQERLHHFDKQLNRPAWENDRIQQ